MIGGVLHDLIHRQVLVLWDMNGLHLIIGDVSLTPTKNVLEEVNRDVVCRKENQKLQSMIHTVWRQVDLALSRQERKALSKRTMTVRIRLAA